MFNKYIIEDKIYNNIGHKNFAIITYTWETSP